MGEGRLSPSDSWVLTPQKQNQGKENCIEVFSKGKTEGQAPLLSSLSARKQFCNPDLSLSPAWLRFSSYPEEQDVGGDFPVVGAPASSPGRYKPPHQTKGT